MITVFTEIFGNSAFEQLPEQITSFNYTVIPQEEGVWKWSNEEPLQWSDGQTITY